MARGIVPERPVVVAEFRATHTTAGGPDKTVLLSAAQHDPARVRVVPIFLVPRGDDAPGLAELARACGTEPIVIPDRGPWDLSILAKVDALLDRHRCRVLHAHDFKTDVLGLFVGRHRGLHRVATAHGWSRLLSGRQRLYHAADRWALRRYKTVIAVSEATACELRRIRVPDERIEVVPNGIDTAWWSPLASPAATPSGINPDREIVGTVGRLSIDKDMETLIHAVTRLIPAHPELELVFVGDGPEGLRLRALVETEGVGEHVRFLGHRTDLRELYASMDVFVLSSRTEGMPNVLLEAMAMERPCVVTAVGGVGELASPGEALHVRSGDADAMAKAIHTLLTERAAAKEMANRARRRVLERFSFAHRLRRMEDLYERLVEAPVSASTSETA